MRLIAFLFFLFTIVAFANQKKQLKVAVIDTGLNFQDDRFNRHLCRSGHKDFTDSGLNDTNGHGSTVVSLIEKYARNANYCFLIYKFYLNSNSGSVNLQN